MEGQTVSHYRILEKIGEGGMGEVYLAEDTSLDRKVALKFLPEYLQRDDIAPQRFLREAKAAAALDHPFICHIHEIGEAEAGPFIAMEYVEGETLKDRLAREPLKYREVLRIGSEITEAVQKAHEQGIIHRDLKPSNIMLTKEGRVKVMDFGLAKRVVTEEGTEQDVTAALTREGTTLGTLTYMSPEQLKGDKIDARSDIFSLGVVLYEMLLGKHPFRRKGPMETASAILKEDPEFPAASQAGPGIALHKTIQGMLAKDPAQRCQSIQEVHSTLERLWEEVTPTPWVRRWQYWAGALAAILAIAALLMVLNQPTSAPEVTAVRSITEDGLKKTPWSLVTDGKSIYYTLGGLWGGDVYQVSVGGGPSVPVWRDADARWGVVDISPRYDELLLLRELTSFWLFRLPGGPPRRLGKFSGCGAAWSPDGEYIAYTTWDKRVCVARSDGTLSETLYTADKSVWQCCWSPDGKRIRFVAGPLDSPERSVWEVNRKGEDTHQVIADAFDCGYWTPGGEHFIFHRRKHRGYSGNLWALRDGTGSLRWQDPDPVPLVTAGLRGWATSTLAPDGKTIYAMGIEPEGQLMKYESASGHWLPYLGGISAHWLDFSRDGEWVAYVKFGDNDLLRCRKDGSQTLKLTGPEILAASPRWSSDGTRVAFLSGKPAFWLNTRLCLVAAEGGSTEVLVEGARPRRLSWSPDGSQIVFDNNIEERIELLDLKTRERETIPGSERTYYPQWSPDGRYLAALKEGGLVLFNFETNEWSVLVERANYPQWSRQDKSWVYFVSNGSVHRVHVTNLQIETIAEIGFTLAGGYATDQNWIGLAPDDSVLALRRVREQEIYALDLATP